MFKSLLIANRGEIACRIIRTARAMGLKTIAVFSEADADAPFVRQADDGRLIGPAPARDSYLVIEKIIAAARETGAEAIHPGYGFLSERAEFARSLCGRRHRLRRPAALGDPGHGAEGCRQGAGREGRRAGGAGLSRRPPGRRTSCAKRPTRSATPC